MPALPVGEWAAAFETHTAALFFAGDHVLKIKKPVALGFLDFSTREARRAACTNEVALNRRLAPDVYLGVADIVVGGETVEHGVLMRRLPGDRSLAALVARNAPSLPDEVARVARILAGFHARCAVVGRELPVTAWTPPDRLWRTNIEQSRALACESLPADVLDAVETMAMRFAEGRRALFDERVVSGLVRDGHGDLLADDVFALPDGPRILDCLEFDPQLRVVDVLLDVAALAMDLERLGRPDLARLLLDNYSAASTERHPVALEHFFVAYRALVRAKVAAIRAQQTGSTSRTAADLLAMCVRHLQAAQLRLVVVGGLPGAGKSTVSADLAGRLPGTVISSDALRWALAPGDVGTCGYGQGRYAAALTDRVYSELVERAGALLARGENVVLDATFADAAHRTATRELARRLGAQLTEICVIVDDATAARRIADRPLGVGRSQADVLVRHQMSRTFAAWPEAIVIDTGEAAVDSDRSDEPADRCETGHLRQ